MVLPFDAKDGAQAALVKLLQLPDLLLSLYHHTICCNTTLQVMELAVKFIESKRFQLV